MKANLRTRFERRLLAERHRVTQLLERLAPATAAASDRGRLGDDLASNVASGGSSDDDAAVIARALQELAEIDGALRVLYEEADRFGVCVACGRPIALGRLDVVPTARFCQRHASG